ncbi:MAG: guanylate kinase [Gammaproteobacteria bacterium]|nr:guanylate kinase [Gammaproteobacteria bacterium]
MSTRIGHCFIFSAPSGCGKSTIVKKLCDMDSKLVTSVSTTTRPQRTDEIEGQHYYFVSEIEFDTMVVNDEFLEHATVFKHRYGTRREQVKSILQNGFDVLFDIDWQGARTVKQRAANVVSFFLIPPSLEELKRRLSTRGQDSLTSVEYRMSQATDELTHYDEFDYVIVNDDLGRACDLVHTCINWIRRGERYSVPSIHGLMKKMLKPAT